MANFSLKLNFKNPKVLTNASSIGSDSIDESSNDVILKDLCGMLLTNLMKENKLSEGGISCLVESVELQRENKTIGVWPIDELISK